MSSMTLGFSIDGNGNVIDDIGFSIERNGNVIDDIDFSIEHNGNAIERKTRAKKPAMVFSRQKRDLRGLVEKKLIRVNNFASLIDKFPVPWWQWLDGMLEGDRLRPVGWSSGQLLGTRFSCGEGYSDGTELLSHAEL